jgi:hypothetical protein
MPISTPRHATGSIAGVALTGTGGNILRAVILDGDRFGSKWRGTDKISPDGTAHVKVTNSGMKSRRFGVTLSQAPVDVLADIKAAIETALDTGQTFRVILTDEVNAIDVQAAPDFKAGDWLGHLADASFGGHAKDVTLRFISTGAGA